VKTNTKSRVGQTAFHLAAKHDLTGEITQVLLQLNHTDADQEDGQMITPIHQTVKSRNTATLKVLIDSGQIDPPFRVNGRIRNLNKWTVMHAVAQYGDEEMTKLLLSYDQVDANARDFDSKTPLHYASSSGNAPFVRCMLESDKVLVNAKDDIGRTPLHVAFMHDSPGVADLLLKSERVNSQEKDLDGLTAFDYSDLLWNLSVGTVQGVQ
jgi:ankyrin repeat protein